MILYVDRLGTVLTGLIAFSASFLPFAVFRANRIVQGEPHMIITALPMSGSILLIGIIISVGLIALFKTPIWLRLCGGTVGLICLLLLIGQAASYLTPPDVSYARVSPASGFWLLCLSFSLLCTDGIVRLQVRPIYRILLMVFSMVGFGLLLGSGAWDQLSIIKEYFSYADSFWSQTLRHVELALGSLILAVITGVPIGIICQRRSKLRSPVLNILNMIQTIPSMALFGIMIAPLSWIALNVPGASLIGIRGIGVAPAFVALYLYSLLPVVANTVAGLQGVSPSANDAARGVGMTDLQRLVKIELPLAFPVILTGIRIVLVQNIGLATIAALIGGGGLGVFVFQGIGQTAMDLVLLGALPTVALAFSAAVILDACIEMTMHQTEPHLQSSRGGSG